MYISLMKKDILSVACWLGHAVQIEKQVQVPALNQTECPQGNDFTFPQIHSFPSNVRTRQGHSGSHGDFSSTQHACRANTALLSGLQYHPCLFCLLTRKEKNIVFFWTVQLQSHFKILEYLTTSLLKDIKILFFSQNKFNSLWFVR